MKPCRLVRLATTLGFVLSTTGMSPAQGPDVLRLTAKVRDFREIPDAVKPPSIPNTHPDFNSFGNCGSKGYVNAFIDTTGAEDPANFPDDRRTPRLINARPDCFTGFERFGEWFNDKDTSVKSPQNNYGFTTEFHARFTYSASDDVAKQQVFTARIPAHVAAFRVIMPPEVT